MQANRRKVLLAAVAMTLAGPDARAASILSAENAHQRAMAGDILLLDIRTPQEWAETGSGQGAHRLDMRRDDFMTALDKLLEGNRNKPVALICAGGVRSSSLSRVLREAGYTNIIDVPEGMLGSYAGPGWLARGLPLAR